MCEIADAAVHSAIHCATLHIVDGDIGMPHSHGVFESDNSMRTADSRRKDATLSAAAGGGLGRSLVYVCAKVGIAGREAVEAIDVVATDVSHERRIADPYGR